MWWTLLAEGSVSEAQARALSECGQLGWEGWLRVLEQDLPHDCGLTWARDDLARVLRGRERVEWVQQGQARPWPSRSRLVGALALERAGHRPVREPRWLALEPSLPSEVSDELLRDPSPLGEPSGARAVVRSQGHALREGDWTADRRRALHTLAAVGGEEAATAHTIATAVLGVEDEGLEALGRDGAPHTLPGPWADAVEAYARCTSGCLPRLLDVLDVVHDDPTGARHPAGPGRATPPVPGRWRGLVEADVAEPIGLLLAEDARWVAGGEWPAQRLASLVRRPGPVPEGWVSRVWTGRMPPAAAALWARTVADAAGLSVAVGPGLELTIGDQVGRLCAVPGPDGVPLATGDVPSAVSDAQLRQWVREEQGRSPAGDDPVGRRVGQALSRDEPLAPHPCPPPVSEG